MIRVKWDDSHGDARDSDASAASADSMTTMPSKPPRRRPPPPPPPAGAVSPNTLQLLHSRGLLKSGGRAMGKGGMGGAHATSTSGMIPEMATISEDATPPVFTPDWSDARFHMNERGQVCNRVTNAKITKDEMREQGEGILRGLIEHVHARMLREFQFVEQAIPALDFDAGYSVGSSYAASSGATGASVRSSSSSICSTADGFRTMIDSDVPRCIFHTSENYAIAEKLLVFVCSSRGLSCGIWSRSLLLQEGVQVGSMIPYFQAARQAGFGILVMNPNMNTQTMADADGVERKLPIQGSSTQEEHCDHVWKNYIFPSAAHKIHFIAYGYGGVLVANLLEQHKYELKNRLGNVAYIESSHKMDPQWSSSFRRFFSQHSVCWKRSQEPLNVEVGSGDPTKQQASNAIPEEDSSSPLGVASANAPFSHSHGNSAFGCLCLSAGDDTSVSTSPAYTTKATLRTVFQYLASPNAYEFHRTIVRQVRVNALREADQQEQLGKSSSGRHGHGHGEVLSNSRVGNSRGGGGSSSRGGHREKMKESVTVDDFQLLRVVGRGAFGKVMLVRKKKKQKRPLFSGSTSGVSRGDALAMSSNGGGGNTSSSSGGSGGSSNASGNSSGGGKVYAMKVIKKAAVFAKNQVEHTKTERRILEGIDHPFAVKLRYAFQNEAKLFFVMDYYNGGTLHFHLRQARRFHEERARFYAAQVVLAISHLHTYNIVYRDLKPENILMDEHGFIAVTDFGLSSDHFDAKGEGLLTFCGTPEYIAPELIRRLPYGRAVDYWSLGVMLYEMIAGYTPFYHTNRKRNFENIVRSSLRFPTEGFSDDAKSVLRGLMTKDPSKRLGSGPTGAHEIMDHPFFASIDWERLYKRDVPVPFRPTVKKDGELNNIPEFFKRQDVMDSAPDMPAPIGKRNEFQDFSYVDPYQL